MSGDQEEILADISEQNIGHELSSNDTPHIGMKFDSEEEAYKFYNCYGKQRGFSIRRCYHHISKKDGVMINRKFVCSKEGEREVDKRDHLIKKHRAQTRTNCSSHMQIVLDRGDNKFVINKWNDDHNHHLHLPECTYLMRSQRNVSAAQGVNVDMVEKSGISLSSSYELMSRQAGGRESLGFIRLDQKNYLRGVRQRKMEFGEAGGLLEYFQSQAAANPSFYYAFQLDAEELITNTFWADPKMIIDYGHFGDVITFDTTFRTNKEYRPLAVFAGLNHFRETVIFGAALLYDETAASFKWLFETFLHAMSGKKPITIFTDQDQAMANAISEVMPDAFHGLCCWHLMQNALNHLGNLFKDHPELSKDFNKCIFEFETEDELLNAWEALLEKYKELQDNKWVAKTWELREKWANVYLKRTFTAGMRSTQLSESVNSNLRKYIQPDHDIPRFFHHFDRFVHDKRYKELESIYNVREKQPELKMRTPILKQAGDIYTPTILKKFQDEIEKSLCCIVKHFDESGQYIVSRYGHERDYFVTFNPSEMTVDCSCRNFEKIGLLCSHALKVFERRDIMQIPERYILKRWRRDARDGFSEDISTLVEEDDPKLVASARYRNLCPKMVQLAARCSINESAYHLVSQTMTDLLKQVDEMCKSKNDDNNDSHMNAQVDVMCHVDPELTGIKGLKRREDGYKGWGRLKPWSEKGRKRGRGEKKEKGEKGEKEGQKKRTTRPRRLSKNTKNSAQEDENIQKQCHQEQCLLSEHTINPAQENAQIQNEHHEEPCLLSQNFEMPHIPLLSQDHYFVYPPSASSNQVSGHPQDFQGMFFDPPQLSKLSKNANFLSDNFYDFFGVTGARES